MSPTSCPSMAELGRLFQSDLPDEETAELERHVADCAACAATLKNLLPAHATLAKAMKGAETQDGAGQHPLLTTLIRQLENEKPRSTMNADATQAAAKAHARAISEDDELTEFLSPPQVAGELGRLGKYRVLEILGRGGMGVVFRAEDPILKRSVALKMMLPRMGATRSAGQRFIREAQAMAAVEHDHIVRVYDAGEERGIPFLAMEFLKGEPLDKRLQQDKPLPIAEVARIGREVAEGLAAAHEKGMIHRDIKPGNLWIESPRGETPGRVKILDFGLARAAAEDSHLTQSGAVMGTPAFMAPEQARGDAVDSRCDLFSLGVVLYRLTTGTQPFRGKDAMSTLMALATETPPPPCQLDANVPAELSGVIMRLLEKDRERRTKSASDAAKALREIERALATAPARVSRKHATTSSLGPLKIGLAVALTAAMIVVAVILTRKPPVVDDAKIVPAPIPAPIAPAPKTLADKEKPFVLIRNGKTFREYKTFAGILDDLAADDTIEVHANGPLPLPQIRFLDKGLSLKAAAGYRPSFVPAEGVEPVDTDAWVRVDGGPIRLEGCDFSTEGTPSNAHMLELNASCEIVGCRLIKQASHANYLLIMTGAKNRIADCLIVGGHSHNTLSLGAKSELDFENNLFWNRSFTYFMIRDGGQRLRLKNNTFFGAGLMFHLPLPAKDKVSVTAERNLFVALSDAALFHLNGNPLQTLTGSVDWKARDNVFASPTQWARAKSQTEIVDRAAWAKIWGDDDVGSRDVQTMPLAFLDVFRGKCDEQIAAIRKRIDRARPFGSDAGPDDWDVIGPGAAYVKALEKRTGKLIPKDLLRPEPHAGGPIVLLRDGKVLAGYSELRDATSVAQDGDTIELRTDRTVAGSDRTSHPKKTLTLRAAPGYLPTIKYLGLNPGDVWTIEGIHFGGINPQNGAEAGQARLVNCSADAPFHGGGIALNLTLFARDKAIDVDVTNCRFAGKIHLKNLTGQPIRVRNSAIGGIAIVEGSENARYELSHCAILPPGVSEYSFSLQSDKGESRIACESCWLGAGTVLTGRIPGSLTWSGDKNVFEPQLGTWAWPMPKEPYPVNLKDWQSLWKSDAASTSVDAPWFDPVNWRISAAELGPDPPKIIGANIDRVLRVPNAPEPKVVEPLPTKPTPPVDRDKPFVLIRDGKTFREFKTFAGLRDDHLSGDVIEIHGNGPFELPRIEWKEKPLHIRAAKGYRPKFVPAPSVSNAGPFWVSVDKSPLRLEGCDFVSKGTHWNLPLIATLGDCQIVSCRLIKGVSGTDRLLQLRGPKTRIADCQIVCGFSYNAIVLGPHCELEFENNLFWNDAYSFFAAESPGGQRIHLKSNTLFGASIFTLDGLKNRVRMTAEQNLFVSMGDATLLGLGDTPTEKIKDLLEWNGRDNAYISQIRWTRAIANNEKIDADTWTKIWGDNDRGSRDIKGFGVVFMNAYRGTCDEQLAAIRTWIDKSRPSKNQNAGPEDWDIIGPGAAYVKALEKRSGKPLPQDQIRPEVLPGGPVALLRNDVVVDGFPGVLEASLAAQDGDVIEIRSDREIPSCQRTGQPKKSLTLRSAPGYSAVMPSLILEKDDVWAVEGIRFLSRVNLLGDRDPGQIRLANCAIDFTSNGGGAGSESVLVGRDKASKVEIVNCRIANSIGYRNVSGQTLFVRNSVIGGITLYDGAGGVELDRCAVWRLGLGGPMFNGDGKGKRSVRCTSCWFQSGSLASSNEDPSTIAWSGDKNVFAIEIISWGQFPPREDRKDPINLQQWQKLWNSDAASVSVECIRFDPANWRPIASELGPRPPGANVDRVLR